jgi:hypothetical protein
MSAVRTGGKGRLHHTVGVFGQHAGDTGPAPARLLRAVGTVRLLALRGRQAGIVRRLRWGGELGFQRRNSRCQRLNLRNLRKDQGNKLIFGQSKKGIAVHRDGESDRSSSVNSPSPGGTARQPRRGREQLPTIRVMVPPPSQDRQLTLSQACRSRGVRMTRLVSGLSRARLRGRTIEHFQANVSPRRLTPPARGGGGGRGRRGIRAGHATGRPRTR